MSPALLLLFVISAALSRYNYSPYLMHPHNNLEKEIINSPVARCSQSPAKGHPANWRNEQRQAEPCPVDSAPLEENYLPENDLSGLSKIVFPALHPIYATFNHRSRHIWVESRGVHLAILSRKKNTWKIPYWCFPDIFCPTEYRAQYFF